MFKALLMTRLVSLRESIFGRAKKRAGSSTGKAALYALLTLLIVLSLFFSVGSMFFLIAKPLINMNLGWLVMSIAALMSVILCFFGSIFMTEKQLFEAKDNDLLLSMPIPPSYILASRMLLIVLSNIFLSIMILLPAFVVYCVYVPATAVKILFFIISTILISLFSSALTSACGWVVALVASRMRHKNLVGTILAIAFLFAYLYFYFNLQNNVAKLLANGAAFSTALSRVFPPAYIFGVAVANSSGISLAVLAAWGIFPFAIIYCFLSVSFIRITTTRLGEVKVRYKEKELKASSVRMALVKKELGRFFSLPMYILNCSLGAIMALVLAGALIVKKDIVLSAFAMSPGTGGSKIALIMCAALCFMAVMNDITAPSVSLEGKNMWFLKSVPVDAADIFFAKVAASLIVTVPLILLSSLIVGAVLGVSPLIGIFLVLTPLAAQVFVSLFGLALNLKLPRFDWLSEIEVIKQSASVMIALFGGIGVVAIPILAYIFIAGGVPAEIYFVICTAYFLLLASGTFAYLKRKGRALFNGF